MSSTRLPWRDFSRQAPWPLTLPRSIRSEPLGRHLWAPHICARHDRQKQRLCRQHGFHGGTSPVKLHGPLRCLEASDLNLWGVIYGLHTFVPDMIARNSGYVVNTASMAGLLPSSSMAPYAASKHPI